MPGYCHIGIQTGWAPVNDELKTVATIRLGTFATETKEKNDFTDITLDWENIKIQRTVLPYLKRERLKILFLEAFTPSGKKIAEYKEIITADCIKK